MNFPPRLSTCSLVAALTSVADTTAPSLFAVAIACKPATPTPSIITFAGFTLPAAVIIIGKAFPNCSAASITLLYPAKLAWDDRTSILCALLILGINSIQHDDILFLFKLENSDLFSYGFKIPISNELFFKLLISSVPGILTHKQTSAFKHSDLETIFAPASS